MIDSLYLRAIQDINEHQYGIDEILGKFYAKNIDDLLEYLIKTFEKNLYTTIQMNNYINNYHSFLYCLSEAINDPDQLEYLAVYIKKHIQIVKNALKPYNKKEKDKDELYNKLCRFKNDLESNYSIAMNKAIDLFDDDNSKILKFIIFDLKDIDAFYHVIDSHKEIINLYTSCDEHLLSYIIRYFIQHMDELDENDIDYYKRVITMIFIRDELRISEKDLREVVEELNVRLSKDSPNKKHFKYLKYIIDNHFRFKCKDNTIYNELIPMKDIEDNHRTDLRYLPTLTIDYVKYANSINMLYDDAFSIKVNLDGTYYIYIHKPDVDEYILRDQELEKYMREKYESRYIKHGTDPMIPFRIARNISLLKGQDRLALTTRLHVDQEGNILSIDFIKSIIKVDNNLSKNKADILIKDKCYDLNWALESMYDVSKELREKRKASKGKRSKAGIILDEFNIWDNIATAEWFATTNYPFAFKNFINEDYNAKHISELREFLHNNKVDEESRNLLYDLSEAKPRPFYSTTCLGNSKFNNLPYANVGNPLREYISLETDRLIKDLVIDRKHNEDFWRERIENDCVEQSEGSQKVKEMYKTNY